MKKYLLIVFMSLAIAPSFQSCKLFQPIQVVSPFSAALVTDINSLGMEADAMYTTMESESDKTFDDYVDQYNSLEVLSNSISARLEAMPKSGAMLKQAQLLNGMLLNHKARHKAKIKLNDSEIRVNKMNFRRQLKPLFVSAMALK